MGNIKDSNRLYAHVIAAYIFSAVILYFLHRENRIYVRLRHEYLTTPEHIASPRATTILILGIPHKLNNEKDLRKLFDAFPGGVKRIWINRDPGDIVELHADREKLISNLEVSETALIRQYAVHLEKKGVGKDDVEDGKKVPKALRPLHKKPPVIGSKIDSIDTYRGELKSLNGKIEEKLKDVKDFKQLNSAFIQFNTYIGAQLAANLTIPRLTEISPGDVIWDNLNLTRPERMIRKLVSLSISTALILLWVIPVTFVASISKLEKLQQVIPFLQPLFSHIPSTVVGIIQGILPAVALAVLMMLLPIVLRLLSKFEGIVSVSRVTISLQSKYYFFLIFNVLLVTTFANGIFEALPPLIHDPTSVVQILAQNLPLSSTFFLTYVLLTLSGSALEIFQIGPFIVNILFNKFLVKTPRQAWDLERTLTSKDWGTSFPPHILMASIGLVFSSIQPLILPIVTIHFTLYYCVYRYNFLYVYNQVYQSGGLIFPESISQFCVGIYIYQLAMIGLMFLNKAFVPGSLMVVLFGLTVSSIMVLKLNFKHNPKVDFLPVDLLGIIDMKTREVVVGSHSIQNGKAKTSTEGIHQHEVSEKDEDDTDAVHITYSQEEEDKGASTYLHPAFVAKQPVVWLPQDPAGVGDEEVDACRKEGINATNRGATLNAKKKIEVDFDNIPEGLEFMSLFGIIRDDDYLH